MGTVSLDLGPRMIFKKLRTVSLRPSRTNLAGTLQLDLTLDMIAEKLRILTEQNRLLVQKVT